MSSGSIVTSMKACLQLVAFVNFVLLTTSVSILQPCFKLFTSVDSCVFLGTIVHCSIAASCSLLAGRADQNSSLRSLSWGGAWVQRKEEAGLICCRALPAQGGVTSSNVEARPMQRFFIAVKQKSSSLSEQDIFKNKAVAKACCFYRYTSCLRQPMKSKSVSTCAFSIYCYSVPYHEGFARGMRDTKHIDTSCPCTIYNLRHDYWTWIISSSHMIVQLSYIPPAVGASRPLTVK